MSAFADVPDDGIDKQFKCPICFKVYGDDDCIPKNVGCREEDDCCESCIDNCAKSISFKDGEWFECPSCCEEVRLPENGADGLDDNVQLLKMAKRAKKRSKPETPQPTVNDDGKFLFCFLFVCCCCFF